MNITGNNSIKSNVFDGGYWGWIASGGLSFNGATILDNGIASIISGDNINPTGVTGISVFFQSGGLLIDSGYQKTISGIASGASATSSNLSGYLYYRITEPIYGLCHGIGRDEDVWYSGYNFYNAFHQDGYFAPPFGQNATVSQMNQDGSTALAENGNCSTLTTQEYNDLYGICTQLDPAINASADSPTAFINSPGIACPQDLDVSFYWHEVQYNLIAGTSASIAGNTYYNTNPIPTALDNFAISTVDRYTFTSSGLPNVPDGQGGSVSQFLNTITYISGKPVPGYGLASQYSTFNAFPSCPGLVAEGGISIGTSVESFLLDAPDVSNVDSTSNFDFFNWWNIWHFLFKENSDGFPFDNGQDNGGGNEGIVGTSNQPALGSNLFEYELSDSDDYWLRRQCPEVVNFMPHTFGGSVYSCPSYYFDIPYYAAIKKFGFYGTRFMNGCVSLSMDYAISGNNTLYPNSMEINTGVTFVSTAGTTDNQLANDKGVNWSFSAYNNLLKIAQAEELSSDFYGLNMALFLWANSGLIAQSFEYGNLVNNPDFLVLYNNLFNGLSAVFPSGIYSLISGQPLFESGASSTLYATGNIYPLLGDNNTYLTFKQSLNRVLTQPNDILNWATIESNFGYAILSSTGQLNTGFYSALATAKQNRISSRYLENYVKGNPVDLYPTNKITFSYDKAGSFINSINWGKSYGGFGLNHTFADSGLTRTFFLGAYGNGQDVSGLSTFMGRISAVNNSSFYPGYFNSNLGNETPIPTYEPVVTGTVLSGMSSTGLSNGWVAMGYNGIGELKGNFSCFTPIFVQQPFSINYCKIGQAPTFRTTAVDYHTIPEDKINNRYPEIVYWTTKLKMVDSNYKNLYPLSYKWYRIPKTSCTGSLPGYNFQNFLLNPNWNAIDMGSPTGTWCALEGDGPICTLIHPQECIPAYNSYNPAWGYEFRNDPSYQTAKQNNFYMTLMKGAIKGVDDQFFYFCMVRGRFGIRISEPAQLFVEDTLKFDLSILNGGNVGAAPTVTFSSNDYSLTMNAISVPKYGGFVNDPDAIPEDVVEKQLPPPNAGYGDVYSYKFVGLWGYRGAAQSYTPGTLNDTRGLIETWGRLLHYGSLAKYSKVLSQTDGDYLYGRNHLPVCNSSFTMPTKQDGIKVAIDGVVHWANMQYPIVDTDGKYGVLWSELGNAGELYVPSTNITNAGQVEISPGIGQWQWGNNLGTIHLFGWNSSQSLLTQTPYQLAASDFQKLKTNLLRGGVLAGDNCGWHKNGLGRNMIYWIEGFSSFYLYCDNLKKKNVTNFNYMNPGLRHTNSSMQYFWLGKPNNNYLERYPLAGPYAYHWKTMPHNRDRNGNGMSQGFYSYGWNQNYSIQYDAPAIYGFNMKYGASAKDIQTMNDARVEVFGADGLQGVKTTRFGVIADADQEGIRYGNIFLGYLPDNTGTASEYVQSGVSFAQNQEFSLYGCSDNDLKNGDCFDPCLSMRYQFGFLAGGKKQDMMTNYPTSGGYRIVPNSPIVGNSVQHSTLIDASGVYFRGAFGTPHLQYLTGAMVSGGFSLSATQLNGMSPCFDGGADHCNYITPTLNYGSSMYQESQRSNFLSNSALASASVNL